MDLYCGNVMCTSKVCVRPYFLCNKLPRIYYLKLSDCKIVTHVGNWVLMLFFFSFSLESWQENFHERTIVTAAKLRSAYKAWRVHDDGINNRVYTRFAFFYLFFFAAKRYTDSHWSIDRVRLSVLRLLLFFFFCLLSPLYVRAFYYVSLYIRPFYFLSSKSQSYFFIFIN